jgi:hypothetical protein
VEARTSGHAIGSPAGRAGSCIMRARSLRHRTLRWARRAASWVVGVEAT